MAMGDAMAQLVSTRVPFRPRANGGSGGVTLTWNNGTEIPTSVRVLRNGLEIATAAPVNSQTFVDASAPLGVNNYELQFTMPITPCPPLTISHNSGITNLKGGQRINGVRLTWENNLGYTGITVKRNGSIIAASLPGNTTSYTDVSPPTGAMTYSVEPDDAGGTPVEIQMTVSAAPAGGALIYEPFDMTAGNALAGNVGGIGLDGKWDGATAIEVTSDNLYTFGSPVALPVFGNRIVRTTSNGSCTIHIGNTLHEAGLMEHGAELWFSFLCQNPNNGNIHPTLALGDDILTIHDKVAMGGNAIGAKLLSGNKVIGTIYSGGAQIGATATQATLASSEIVLVVGRITWGADATAQDTIAIFTPGTDLALDTPLSVSGVVDQSKFKVLSMWGNGVAPNMDEIRFGDSYLDVIGQGTDTSGDFTPPTPAKMSFASPPAASSTTAITMIATTATDANGVQYFFDETSGRPGGTDSEWQDSPVYTDTGLDPDTEYTYTVQARDKSVNNITNTVSDPASATTFPPDTTPPSPATMSFATPPAAASTTSITMTATTASDDSGVEYFFNETSGNPGGSDSAWQDSPVYTDTGLTPDTEYTYTVQARDKSVNNNPNTASSPASATTFPPDINPPPTPGFSVAPNATSSSAITMTATTVTDAEGGTVEYFFDETSGNPGGTDSGWQSSPTYTDSGLSPNTQYTYTVRARDNALPPNESTASAPASATTPASPATGTQFWDGGGGDANWNTPENWGGDGLPAFGTTAINFGSLSSLAGTAFGNVVVPSQTTANNDLTAGTLIVGINFGNNGQANRTDAYTLQGNSIAFGNATNQTIGTTALHAAAIVSSIEDVVSLNMDLGSPVAAQNRQFQALAKHHLKIDGVISGGANAVVLARVIDSKLTLTNANNSYLGATNIASQGNTTVNESLLEITSIANGGSNSSIGASSNAAGNLRFNFGFNDTDLTTLRYIGGTNASTDRLFTLYGNITGTNSRIESSGLGTLSFTNTGAIASGHQKARNFYLGGTNTGDNTFAPSLSNFTEVTTFTKQGVGKWIITGAHTYTGATTVSEGTLELGVSDCLANTSNVVIGAGTLDVGAGFTDTVGTLDCTGAATISLGNATSRLAFADSSGVDWTDTDPDGTLTITGTFVPGDGVNPGSLRFGDGTGTGLSVGQLASISATGWTNFGLDVNGYLTASPVGGGVTFAGWRTVNGAGSQTLADDHDNDGVDNGTEFFLGGDTDTTGFTALPTIVDNAGTLSVTWPKHPNYPGAYNTDFVVETSDTLAGPWTTEATPPSTVTISGNNVTYTFPNPLGTKKFARLKVTGPN
jgi:autotransporter-associated beta strand protein